MVTVVNIAKPYHVDHFTNFDEHHTHRDCVSLNDKGFNDDHCIYYIEESYYLLNLCVLYFPGFDLFLLTVIYL